MGLEPTTSGATNQRSNHLSYNLRFLQGKYTPLQEILPQLFYTKL